MHKSKYLNRYTLIHPDLCLSKGVKLVVALAEHGNASQSKPARIVVACMDRRLSNYLDRTYNDGSTLFIRNAGPDASRVIATISGLVSKYKSGDRKIEIVVVAHSDCGACSIAYSALKEGKVFDDIIKGSVVESYKSLSFSTRNELESKNPGLQIDRIYASLPGSGNIPVLPDFVKISSLKVPEHLSGEHELIIARPSDVRYAEMMQAAKAPDFNTYIVQAATLKEILPDTFAAVVILGAKRISFVAVNSDSTEAITGDIEFLRKQQFIKERMDPDKDIALFRVLR